MQSGANRRALHRAAHAAQLQLPLEEADIRHNKKVRGVYRDRKAHHAIVYKIGKIKISFVEMKQGRLVTRSLPDIKFFNVRADRISGRTRGGKLPEARRRRIRGSPPRIVVGAQMKSTPSPILIAVHRTYTGGFKSPLLSGLTCAHFLARAAPPYARHPSDSRRVPRLF